MGNTVQGTTDRGNLDFVETSSAQYRGSCPGFLFTHPYVPADTSILFDIYWVTLDISKCNRYFFFFLTTQLWNYDWQSIMFNSAILKTDQWFWKRTQLQTLWPMDNILTLETEKMLIKKWSLLVVWSLGLHFRTQPWPGCVWLPQCSKEAVSKHFVEIVNVAALKMLSYVVGFHLFCLFKFSFTFHGNVWCISSKRSYVTY